MHEIQRGREDRVQGGGRHMLSFKQDTRGAKGSWESVPTRPPQSHLHRGRGQERFPHPNQALKSEENCRVCLWSVITSTKAG